MFPCLSWHLEHSFACGSFLQLKEHPSLQLCFCAHILCRARCLRELTCSLELVSFAEEIRGTYRRQLLADHQGEISAKVQAELCRDLNMGVSGTMVVVAGNEVVQTLGNQGDGRVVQVGGDSGEDG